jgi:hypothetical protein
LESRINPVYHSVRRQDAQGLIAAPFTQNAVHPHNLAANAAIGVFPSVQTLDAPIVWRPVQQQKLSEAVAAGLWQPMFDSDHTLNVQQPDDDLLES